MAMAMGGGGAGGPCTSAAISIPRPPTTTGILPCACANLQPPTKRHKMANRADFSCGPCPGLVPARGRRPALAIPRTRGTATGFSVLFACSGFEQSAEHNTDFVCLQRLGCFTSERYLFDLQDLNQPTQNLGQATAHPLPRGKLRNVKASHPVRTSREATVKSRGSTTGHHAFTYMHDA